MFCLGVYFRLNPTITNDSMLLPCTEVPLRQANIACGRPSFLQYYNDHPYITHYFAEFLQQPTGRASSIGRA